MQHVNPYKTASELGITEDERSRLIDLTLRLPSVSKFSMPDWDNCIKGHMYGSGAVKIESSSNIRRLFLQTAKGTDFPLRDACWAAAGTHPMSATKEQAVIAINHFLVHGE
jgi:hypothetical protein